MKISLNADQKETLENQHAKTRDGRERDRIKAVLLASENWTVAMISQALRIHESTVLRHLHDYELHNKLKPENGGSLSHLTEQQTQSLIEHLRQVTYAHTFQIVVYVYEQFRVSYTVAGMNKWLHHHSFSYKKPKGVPHKFDEQKQQEFIEAYQSLKARCGKDESIMFMDAVHPTQATKIAYGWIPTGVDKPLETTGSRTRLNIIGALSLTDIAKTVVGEYETINGEYVVQFLNQLRGNYPPEHKIHLILDGAGYHRSGEVKDAAKLLNIELHYLPPYSPNLNPIERLWKVMNEQVRNNRYFKSKKEFKAAIDRFFMETLPDIGDSLVSRINDNFQILKSASSS